MTADGQLTAWRLNFPREIEIHTCFDWASTCCTFTGGNRMSFGIYILGFLILIAGLIYGAVMLKISGQWIAVGAIVLFGLAILKGVQATRGRDPS